jgi:cytochrome c6
MLSEPVTPRASNAMQNWRDGMKPMRNRILLVIVATIVLISLPALAADDAASLYKAKCAGCHGADGSGSAMGKKLGAHDFHSAEVQKMSDDELKTAIAEGKGKMPGYKRSLSEQQIKDLVAYVRSLMKK